MKYLSAAKFAKAAGVTPPTVRNWIKMGFLEGVTKDDYGFYVIPESELKKPEIVAGKNIREKKGRNSGWVISGPNTFSSENDAADRFNQTQGNIKYPRTMRCSYDELRSWFATNKPYQEIADHYGVTRQRIEQLYNKYYAPFMGPAKVRTQQRREQTRKEKHEKKIKSLPYLSVLQLKAQTLGIPFAPVASPCDPGHTSYYFVDLKGRRCKVQSAPEAVQMSPLSDRKYFRFSISIASLRKAEFNIFIAGVDPLKYFVVPTQILIDYFKPNEVCKQIYIPEILLPPYNNQLPDIKFWDYHEKWDLL